MLVWTATPFTWSLAVYATGTAAEILWTNQIAQKNHRLLSAPPGLHNSRCENM